MEKSALEKARLLLAEVKGLDSKPSSKVLDTSHVATLILQRASLRDTLELLIAYIQGYETGHTELVLMVQRLLSITREYQDSAGKRYLNLKPGTGTRFQELLTDIAAYLETHKI